MYIEFLGHSAFYIETENFKILIDPFLLGNPWYQGSLDRFQSVDYIFVTHGHGDHIGDTAAIAKLSGAVVISNFEIVNYLSKFGLKCHPMHIGGRFRFPFGKVKMTPALHGSSIKEADETIDGGNPGGFVIELEGKKIYHAGDTGLTMDMQLLAIEEIDLALIPIGGNFTMDVDDAIRGVEFIMPKIAIPMHYNTFDMIKTDPQEFVDGIPKEVKGIILEPGTSFEL